MRRINDFFLLKSSKFWNSILDWIRSIYFALFGSSVLNFSLNFFTFEFITRCFYLIGIGLLLFGLIISVVITKRFKDYEKSWPEDVPNPDDKAIDVYCKEQDESKSWQHTILFMIWIPALLSIGACGFKIEDKTKSNKLENKVQLIHIENDIKHFDSSNIKLNKIKAELDSIYIDLKKIGVKDSSKIVKKKPTFKK
jgi:uncharacterized membrane protein YhaH (DUF805 family)